jgi:hypothetical protein
MFRTEGLNNKENRYYDGPPGTIIEPEHLNAIQEEICGVIEGAGIAVQAKSADSKTQLLQALNDYFFLKPYTKIIGSQDQFRAIIERVGANHYKIKDGIYSVYLKYYGYNYACAGGSSFLSGGDSYGYIDTNQCTCLEADPLAWLDFDTSAGYLNVNTDHCQLKAICVFGASGSASQSFQLAANYVEFINCKAGTRTSSASFAGFRGSATALHNSTSKYIGCASYSLTGSANVYGFHTCSNLADCVVYSLTSPVSGETGGFYYCNNLSSCVVTTISSAASHCTGYYSCYQVSGCLAYTISANTNGKVAVGFGACYNVSGCKAESITGGAGEAYGFNSSYNISGCYALTISVANTTQYATGFNACYNVSGCSASAIDNTTAGQATGYQGCSRVSGCYANDIDSGVGAGAISHGFFNCTYISACFATDIDAGAGGTANGFNTCTYGSSLYTDEAANASNDYIDAADATLGHQFSSLGV